jgi:short-subunit dehydrogenase involved in D-alanine esterification of teichoic acids
MFRLPQESALRRVAGEREGILKPTLAIMRLENHVALITGGGSGIGLALARGLLDRNNTVVISGRNPTKLAEAKRNHPGLHTIEADATDLAQSKMAIDWIVSQFGRLSLLVNNAGIMHTWDVLRQNDAEHLAAVEDEVATNYLAPIKLTMLALPRLLAEDEAAIVNIASVLALAPIARFPVYCGTKAALHSFSKSLRHQLESTRVKVFDVLPPRTATDLSPNLKTARTSAETVAKKTLRGMARNRYEIAIGESKTLKVMERIAPRLVEHRLVGLLDEASL